MRRNHLQNRFFAFVYKPDRIGLPLPRCTVVLGLICQRRMGVEKARAVQQIDSIASSSPGVASSTSLSYQLAECSTAGAVGMLEFACIVGCLDFCKNPPLVRKRRKRRRGRSKRRVKVYPCNRNLATVHFDPGTLYFSPHAAHCIHWIK